MSSGRTQSGNEAKRMLFIINFYGFLARRAYSVIILGALVCTLAVKFFHSWRMSMVGEYPRWILTDIAVLVGAEVVLAAVCYRWRRRWVVRIATVVAAVICTWSVMNAGWLIRTGTQILPGVVLSLIHSPLNSLGMVGINLLKMPVAAVALLGPSAVALAFFFTVLAKPPLMEYDRQHFLNKVFVSCILVFVSVAARAGTTYGGSGGIASEELRYNCHLKALTSLIVPGSVRLTKADLAEVSRKVPAFDEIKIGAAAGRSVINHNVVVIVLEGIQYRYTSLAKAGVGLTPYMKVLAKQGVEFSNARSTLTHTTKALFSLMTGRFPSVSHDIVEAIPAAKPYWGICTALKDELGFRTAFFQSAKGDFECRPGLVHSLGFDELWTREDANDPNAFLGSLGCDEFAMLEPITTWIKAAEAPFFLTVLCSVTHDPYEVPEWFAAPAKDLASRYRQTISYTDEFIAALDDRLRGLGLADKTIFCVVGDHGEAFGEHGLFGHERIAFDEVLRIPWVMRAPSLIEPATRVTEAVSSVDFTPTLLALMGFDIRPLDLDGVDALGSIGHDRKVYFSGWMEQGCTGYIEGDEKYVYNAANKALWGYDLRGDPCELARIELPEDEAKSIADEILTWRKNSIFAPNEQASGKKVVFNCWVCNWNRRVSYAKYRAQVGD